jgi:hypothetical protein
MFVIAERRRFAGRTARHEAMRALPDLPSHELLKCALIDISVAERCDQRDERSLEHCFLPGLRRNRSTIVLAGAGFNSAPFPAPLAGTSQNP